MEKTGIIPERERKRSSRDSCTLIAFAYEYDEPRCTLISEGSGRTVHTQSVVGCLIGHQDSHSARTRVWFVFWFNSKLRVALSVVRFRRSRSTDLLIQRRMTQVILW
jgi:hypothetical protein